jgi:hypothetical protein
MATNSDRQPDGQTASQDAHRFLVVAAAEIDGTEVRNAVAERAGDSQAEVRVMAPSLTETRFQHAAGAIDDARERAQARLEHSLEELRRAGIEATGEVGDADLRLAIQDSLQSFDADEILVVAHQDHAPPMEAQGIDEAEQSFGAPITEIYVSGEGESAPHVEAVEHKEPTAEKRAGTDEVEGRSHNFPPFSPFDIFSILVALVGTGVLVVLAADCGGDESFNVEGGFSEGGGSFGACEVRLLIAGLVGLVNLAHVVGLMLFQSGPYRGVGRKAFSWMSLIGTPVAIVVSLLIE